MRFCFCGDQDCPDWVLAEIATLSKITSVKMKLLCAQVINDILGQQIDYAKVYQLTSDAKFDTGDVKACIAALNFILCSAAKHNVNPEFLENEIQQLGLPKEHSVAFCKLYGDNLKLLQSKLREEVLRLSHTESIDWRVDYVLNSSQLKDLDSPIIQFRIGTKTDISSQPEFHSFSLTSHKLQVLLNDVHLLVTEYYKKILNEQVINIVGWIMDCIPEIRPDHLAGQMWVLQEYYNIKNYIIRPLLAIHKMEDMKQLHSRMEKME